jgi:hypothetical protein
MRASQENGFSTLIVPFLGTVVLLVGAVTFGAWAYGKMLDYKDNVNSKVDAAVIMAKQQEATTKNAQFAQAEKYPLKTYTSSATYGSVVVKYPNTWSAYVIDDTNVTPYVDGYFYPNTVPDTQSPTADFALRMQILQDSYSSVLSNVQSDVQQGLTTVSPYKAPNVPNVVGSELVGQLPSISRTGTMVVIPLRTLTLELWTEGPQFLTDFNNIVLPNFTFLP